MIELLALGAIVLQHSAEDKCASTNPIRDAKVCEYLDKVREREIHSVESVAVGTGAEMKALRPKARECGLINWIDYVGATVAVFDIINADSTKRSCMLTFIDKQKPELKFSEKRLDDLLQEHSASKDAPCGEAAE